MLILFDLFLVNSSKPLLLISMCNGVCVSVFSNRFFSDDSKILVIDEFPGGWIAEVRIVEEGTTSLLPSHRLHLFVAVEKVRLRGKVVPEGVNKGAVEGKTPSPPNFHFYFCCSLLFVIYINYYTALF